ncbi:MAG: hypothetical protein JRD68_06535 [Deltaproteobacteria bacterium]|nr:hypothetical protein [Deltaproteobacteria bacterium]
MSRLVHVRYLGTIALNLEHAGSACPRHKDIQVSHGRERLHAGDGREYKCDNG